jgi:hypothetical protein
LDKVLGQEARNKTLTGAKTKCRRLFLNAIAFEIVQAVRGSITVAARKGKAFVYEKAIQALKPSFRKVGIEDATEAECSQQQPPPHLGGADHHFSGWPTKLTRDLLPGVYIAGSHLFVDSVGLG